MKIIRFDPTQAHPITAYESVEATAVALGAGDGRSHVYCVRCKPGGSIGSHRAGPAQLFLVMEGSGWVAGADGVRHTIKRGEGARIEAGEMHAKGSDTGMTALMVQIERMDAS